MEGLSILRNYDLIHKNLKQMKDGGGVLASNLTMPHRQEHMEHTLSRCLVSDIPRFCEPQFEFPPLLLFDIPSFHAPFLC